jgi:phage/plasmid-like protein (TIGR03299 family)
VVCANTFKAAELEGDRTGAFYSFRHTNNWRNRVNDAKEAIQGARADMAHYCELAEELLKIVITPIQRERFITEFIPAPPEALISDRVSNNIEKARETVRTILASDTTANVAHTGYGLVQAAGEYLDHVRGYRNRETYLNRTLLKPEPLKHKALTLVREIAAS